MATGTQIYNREHEKIYPISDATVITTSAKGYENVEAALIGAFEQIGKLSGSDETVNNIIVEVRYMPANTTDEDEIKISTKQWSDTFELPTEENPYIWKRTKFTYQGAAESDGTTIYEIVASDISTVIQTIYTRVANDTITPTIEYKKKTADGETPVLDSEGEVTYDYNYYYDGSPATKMEDLPPAAIDPKTGEKYDYTWTDYPQDISQSYTAVFMARRIKQGGKWGPFSTPAQYGQWPSNTN